MVTPAAVDALFVAWLRDHEHGTPTDRELAAYIAGLPLAAQRRAAQHYARGFVRGCAFCRTLDAAQAADDLATMESRTLALLAFIRVLRGASPKSPP